jgi:hypothetical protein
MSSPMARPCAPSSVTVTPTMLTMVRVAELDHAPAGTQRTTSCGAKYGTALGPRSVWASPVRGSVVAVY